MIGPQNIIDLLGLEVPPGLPKPTLVPSPSAAVNGKLVCFYAAQGEPAEAIAKKLNISLEFVQGTLESQVGSELVIRLQTALYPDVRVRVQKTAHMAMDVKMRILATSSNEALRDKVATDILDRSLGKATQVTENRNINLDAKDAEALQRQLEAGRERLDKIESMKRALQSALPVTVNSK